MLVKRLSVALAFCALAGMIVIGFFLLPNQVGNASGVLPTAAPAVLPSQEVRASGILPTATSAASCARSVATSVNFAGGVAQAVPLADVLCLVAAAPAITTLPEDLVPPLERAENDFGLPAGMAQCDASDGVSEVPDCIFGDPNGSRTVVFYGDSHAEIWWPAFDLLGKRLHWQVILLAKSACTPAYMSTYNPDKKAPFVDCDRWHDYAIARINQMKPDMVVVTSITGVPIAPGVSSSRDEWEAALTKTLNMIAIPNGRKVVLGSTPNPKIGHPPNQIVGPNCLAAHVNDVQTCSASTDYALGARYQPQERSAAAKAGAQYISTNPWFCTADVCPAVIGTMNVYVHNGHVSRTYATYLSGALQSELQPIMDSP